MDPESYYRERVFSLQKQLALLTRRKSLLGWARLITGCCILVLAWFLWPLGLAHVLISSTILLVIFIRFVFADLDNNDTINHCKFLARINEDELKALDHNYFHFSEGKEFIPHDHFYSNDLDIFGHASLYQYISRTTSEMGNECLADWLLHPACSLVVKDRQDAVNELASKPEWLQEIRALGLEKKILLSTRLRLNTWVNEPNTFQKFAPWKWLRYILPAIILIIVGLNIFDVLPTRFMNIALLVYAILAYSISKRVSPIHQQLSRMVDELDVLSESIKSIEKKQFGSALLQKLQSAYHQEKHTASADLQSLKKILERLDLRYNPVVFIPLDVLLLWDLQQVLDIEKWKQKTMEKIPGWFDSLGSIEALNSLSTLYFNHPNWSFPVLHEKDFYLQGENIGHPLINKSKRVNNDIKMDESGEIMLVTGSNMAGKSTYLRSVGINVVLAMAGAPVCAKYFELSPVQLLSSMRVSDNLEENTSTFYAELKKLKTIIEKINNNEKVFILLDEILRGTNSLDRHTGSKALIRQLIKHNASAILATHDVELAKLAEEYPSNMLNYHFDVQVSNDELYFDYKLKTGVCTSLNASILMKKIGIEIS